MENADISGPPLTLVAGILLLSEQVAVSTKDIEHWNISLLLLLNSNSVEQPSNWLVKEKNSHFFDGMEKGNNRDWSGCILLCNFKYSQKYTRVLEEH